MLMACFRAFTRREDGEGGVPRLRDLCGAHGSWAEAAVEWLKGGMPCGETKRYVQNYMGAVDMRPVADEDLVKHEDDLYSDEELGPRMAEAAARLKTRVGGAPMEKEDRRVNASVEGEKEKARRQWQGATPRGATA